MLPKVPLLFHRKAADGEDSEKLPIIAFTTPKTVVSGTEYIRFCITHDMYKPAPVNTFFGMPLLNIETNPDEPIKSAEWSSYYSCYLVPTKYFRELYEFIQRLRNDESLMNTRPTIEQEHSQWIASLYSKEKTGRGFRSSTQERFWKEASKERDANLKPINLADKVINDFIFSNNVITEESFLRFAKENPSLDLTTPIPNRFGASVFTILVYGKSKFIEMLFDYVREKYTDEELQRCFKTDCFNRTPLMYASIYLTDFSSEKLSVIEKTIKLMKDIGLEKRISEEYFHGLDSDILKIVYTDSLQIIHLSPYKIACNKRKAKLIQCFIKNDVY